MSKLDPYYEIKSLILKKIKEYDKIVLFRHKMPDGDCLGSAYGMRSIIRNSFPEKEVYCYGYDESKYLSFIGHDDEITEDDCKDALAIVVDTATTARICGEGYKYAKEVIKIDHHPPVDNYGDINYVRDQMPAATTIIMDFFNTFEDELKMDADGARALYVGTVTDTGMFKYANATGETFRLAADMLDYGFDKQAVHNRLDTVTFEIVKLRGHIVSNFKITKNGVAHFYIDQAMQKKYKVSNDDAAAQVNAMANIEGILAWVLFIEKEDKTVRVRLRSRGVSVNEVAKNYRGGGHDQASGATVESKAEMKALLADLDEAVRQYKETHKDAR